MSKNKETVTVIVNGIAQEVEANINAPLHTLLEHALEVSGNTGQPKENWELRDEQGNILDLSRKIEEYGFSEATKLFLNLKAGVGG